MSPGASEEHSCHSLNRDIHIFHQLGKIWPQLDYSFWRRDINVSPCIIYVYGHAWLYMELVNQPLISSDVTLVNNTRRRCPNEKLDGNKYAVRFYFTIWDLFSIQQFRYL